MSEELIPVSPDYIDEDTATLHWYSTPTEPDIKIDDDLSICTKASADKFVFCKYFNKPFWIIQHNGYYNRSTLTVPEELGVVNLCKNNKNYIMFNNVHHEIMTAIELDEFFGHIEDPIKRDRKGKLDLVKTKRKLLKEKMKRRYKCLNKHIVYDAAECLWAYEFSMSKYLSQDIKRKIISYLTK